MKTKLVYAIDAILLVSTVGFVLFVMFYLRPGLISPENGITTTGAVLFSFDKGDRLYIDDNTKFTSPEVYEVNEDMLISLNPGVYYWKVEGVLTSEIREITIKSVVELRIKKNEEGRYDLINGGNERLNVDIYDKGRLTGNIVLDKNNAEKNVSGDKFIGGMDG